MQFSADDLRALAPVLILFAGGLVLLLTEVFLSGERRQYQPILAGLAAVTAGLWNVWLLAGAAAHPYSVAGGYASLDGFACFAGAAICAGLFLTVLVASGYLGARAAERGEFYALCLLAGAGMCLLVSGSDLLFLFIALEIMSVATYALACYLRAEAYSTEASLKYFMLGATSSAIFLFGIALSFGASGHTSLAEIARAPDSPLLVAGLGLLLVGLAFKVAAVPFHMWAPDVYEGAPTPVTVMMAVAVKVASFGVLARLLLVAFSGPISAEVWRPIVGGLAVLTMVGGNLWALTERSVKRMLAYSSVAHAGYLLVAVAAGSHPATRSEATAGLLFYLASYTAAAGGAFAAVSMLERLSADGPQPWDLERFAGLGQRRPLAAAAITVLMLSLGGIPPTAGAMGKLLIFHAAVDSGEVGLAVVGVMSSLLGLFFYLRVVGYLYLRAPSQQSPSAPQAFPSDVALVGSAIATLWMGIWVGPLAAAAQAAGVFFAG